ncbi:tetraacyldisaccharide 4'-kinase [Stappia sp. F7233]|uniref:Tetraacyldisaccharide 4'-kinase n=1 Tax=Stappia albiluteola TaxID=2758565 RepID=A0A839AFF7_9HYPH|nr:tetraacyldisaccharide 4'-kinase [Stappia albiluteola]MBA5778371.1 tetraacyldisaccharide 4'-kinase [Stappia albiluteola]
MALFGRAPAFWWQPQPSLQALALWPIGAFYGAVTASRMLGAPSGKVDTGVVCIGNFVAGGTGKTPFSLAFYEHLARRGRKPVFLLRGHGGAQAGPLLVDPLQHRSEDVGDEALLLAERGPTVVSRNRLAGAELAARHGDMILMDDGWQNPSLAKDFSFALVDAATGVGNGFCLPAGPLRAPVGKQIVAASALVVVGEGNAADPVIRFAARKGLPIFHARLEARIDDDLRGSRVLAFAGIGRPAKFFDSLRDSGVDVVAERAFADHQPYSRQDAESLLMEAEEKGLELVTTTKDMVRLKTGDGEVLRWLAARARVVEAEMRIDDAGRMVDLVLGTLRRKA